jgi:hypothetical protein
LRAGRSHAGIILLIGNVPIGAQVRRMDKLLAAHTAESLRDQLVYLSAAFD